MESIDFPNEPIGDPCYIVDQHLELSARSHRGRVRENNEDAIGTLPECRTVVVADGMGGYKGGEVASRMAVDVVIENLRGYVCGEYEYSALEARELLEHAVQSANESILEASAQVPELHGMGTTIVVGCFIDGYLVFAHVGDSRLYRFQDGRLQQLTRDHSLVQDMMDRGFFESPEDAVGAGVSKNVLTRALGTEQRVEVDVGVVEVAPGDLYLFCTDGLTNMLGDDELQWTLGQCNDDPDDIAERMVQMACDRGGFDNISLVLARIWH